MPSHPVNHTTYQQGGRISRLQGQNYRNVIICVTGKAGKRPAKRLSNGKNRDFQRKKRHLAMGYERTAPFATPENPPALRVEVTGLAHKASGLSPASFRSSVLSAISRGNPTLGTDHRTDLIRLILCRGFLPSKRPQKCPKEGLRSGRGLFPYPSCESRTQVNGAGFR